MPSASTASGSASFHARTFRRLIVLPSFSLCYPCRTQTPPSPLRLPPCAVVDPLSYACDPAEPPATAGSPVPPRPRIPDQMRSQMPINPSGEAITIARNDEPDHRVEAPADQPAGRPRESCSSPRWMIHDEGEGAEPGALDPRQAADHGDHQEVDRRLEADVGRRELPRPPGEEHTAERRDERRRSRTRACGAACTL